MVARIAIAFLAIGAGCAAAGLRALASCQDLLAAYMLAVSATSLLVARRLSPSTQGEAR